jgi:hypothetical protein
MYTRLPLWRGGPGRDHRFLGPGWKLDAALWRRAGAARTGAAGWHHWVLDLNAGAQPINGTFG